MYDIPEELTEVQVKICSGCLFNHSNPTIPPNERPTTWIGPSIPCSANEVKNFSGYAIPAKAVIFCPLKILFSLLITNLADMIGM